MRSVVAVMKRELSRMVSRPIYLVMTIIIPLIVVVFFATFLNKGVPTQLPIAVIDLDNSSLSRQMVRTISAGQFCKVQYEPSSYLEAQSLMHKGDIYAFVVIPKDFQKNVVRQNSPEVIYCTEYVHYLAGSLIMKELTTTLNTLSAGANLKLRLAKGEDLQRAMANIQPIRTDVHIIGNPTLNYAYYLSSILMPGIIFLMSLICTIYVIGIELKYATSRLWIATSEGSIAKALLGKLLPYTLLFSLMEVFSQVILEKYLGFSVHGNATVLYLGSILTIVAYQAIGIFIIGALPVLRTALSIGAFYGTLGFTLAGFTYPNLAMLSAVRPFSFIYPLRQFYQIYADTQLNDLGVAQSWQPFLVLMIFFLLPLFVLSRLKSAAVWLNYERD